MPNKADTVNRKGIVKRRGTQFSKAFKSFPLLLSTRVTKKQKALGRSYKIVVKNYGYLIYFHQIVWGLPSAGNLECATKLETMNLLDGQVIVKKQTCEARHQRTKKALSG